MCCTTPETTNKDDTYCDCVIVGYNDTDFSAYYKAVTTTKIFSGAYRNLNSNTVCYQGERMTYMDLLNKTLEEATGLQHRLHLYEIPNLAVCYLKSYLQKRKCSIEIVNFFNHDKLKFKNLLSSKPAAVAITTTFYLRHGPITEIVRFVKDHSPETKVIVGGPHIYDICSTRDVDTQNDLFKQVGADIYIYDSQGEETLFRTLQCLRNNGSKALQNIPNLIYTYDQKQFCRTERKPEQNDLNINAIDWRYFHPNFYSPTVQVRTSRSCPFRCSFCRHPMFAGKFSLTNVEVVEKELQQLKAARVKYVTFVDDTFNIPLARFKELCRSIRKTKADFEWFSYFRCSDSDDETFDLMKESGCKMVFLGIESGSQIILNNMNKNATIERYLEAIQKLKERGIVVFVSLIIGFPGETEDTIKETIDFINQTSPTFYRAELYYHDVRTPIQKRASEFELEGKGYSWQHKSMDWKRASDIVADMYRSIKCSTILPVYTLDFWAIPYLMGKGFSMEQITAFLHIAQEILIKGLDEDVPDTSSQKDRLLSLFKHPENQIQRID
jgi:radical SAM PhpK family P-methyltransferase